jgi:hypothetical protein
MICIKHNYTKRDPFDLLAERVGLAKNDIDNSFKSWDNEMYQFRNQQNSYLKI